MRMPLINRRGQRWSRWTAGWRWWGETQQGSCTGLAHLRVPQVPSRRASWDGSLVKKEFSPATSPLGVSAAPTPGEEEGSTPTSPSDLEDWIVTQVGPGVAAVPLGEETTAILDFTIEPENQTAWEPAYTPAGTYPLPGLWGLLGLRGLCLDE